MLAKPIFVCTFFQQLNDEDEPKKDDKKADGKAEKKTDAQKKELQEKVAQFMSLGKSPGRSIATVQRRMLKRGCHKAFIKMLKTSMLPTLPHLFPAVRSSCQAGSSHSCNPTNNVH